MSTTADYRIESLKQIITGLDNSIKSLFARAKERGWYDGGWALEESEPIYGLALIAFQNYINGSIKDIAGTSVNKPKFYQIGQPIEGYQKTHIELIICLANYIKHVEDDDPFHGPITKVLTHFQLRTDKTCDIDDSPIFKGFELLDENSNLVEIMKNVKDWRENLWK
ncbi:MAG: hypothetical protein RL308_92 [Bacteroidota bacterium]|jgi:hypothetical protein